MIVDLPLSLLLKLLLAQFMLPLLLDEVGQLSADSFQVQLFVELFSQRWQECQHRKLGVCLRRPKPALQAAP